MGRLKLAREEETEEKEEGKIRANGKFIKAKRGCSAQTESVLYCFYSRLGTLIVKM